jgi:hypothetical protein
MGCHYSNVNITPSENKFCVVPDAAGNPGVLLYLLGNPQVVDLVMSTIAIVLPHLNSFSSESVGKLVIVTKVSVVIHNGTRGITLNKESALTFKTIADHFASSW